MRRPARRTYNTSMDDTPDPPAPPREPTVRWSVGGLFIEALARRDFAAMADCLESDVRLRALLPPGPVEAVGCYEVVGRFQSWFGGPADLELVDGTVGEVGPRLYLRWRVGLTRAATGRPRRIVEQHVFATTSERITALDLLCSGFVTQSSTFSSMGSKEPCQERQ